MSTKTVLIKLSPIGHYFFGGETTFGNGEERNYFARSGLLPQQTALLGMLRYELLQRNNALSVGGDIPDKAGAIVGEKGFDHNEVSPNFGCIKSLSPLFLWNEDSKQAYFKMSKEKIAIDDNDCDITEIFLASDSMLQYVDTIKKELKNYSAKHPFQDYWVNKEGEVIKNDEIFGKSLTKIGIRKDTTPIRRKNKNVNDEIEKENGFYKQELHCLKPNWQFAFLLSYDTNFVTKGNQESLQFFEKENFIVFGAEQSVFKMMVQDDIDIVNSIRQVSNDKTFSKYPYPDTTHYKLILLSDAYVANDIYSKCTFAIADIQPFRSILSSLKETTEWVKMSYTNSKERTKSNKLNLLARGSVFYCKHSQLKEMEEALSNTTFETIGYNHFSIIPPKQKQTHQL